MHTPTAALAFAALALLTACPDDVTKLRDMGTPAASPLPALEPNASPVPTSTLTPAPAKTPTAEG